MEKRRLGKTDIEIMPVGLGCWQFGTSGSSLEFWGVLPQETVNLIIDASIHSGVDLFDTAEAYGDGSSERALSWGLQNCGIHPGEVVIATKWKPNMRTARSLIRTYAQRRASLNSFPIDLYQIHSVTSISSIRAQMCAMVNLLDTGQIRSVGVSNFPTAMMRKANAVLLEHGHSLASNQVIYNLLNRSIERNGILEAAKDLGISIIAYSPLAQGILTGKFHNGEEDIQNRPGPRKHQHRFQKDGLQKSAPLIKLLNSISHAYGVTPAQIALNWLITANPNTVIVIPGASDPHHAEDNANAASFRLTQKEIIDIDVVSHTIQH